MKRIKRVLSLFLSFALLFSVVPTNLAFAEELSGKLAVGVTGSGRVTAIGELSGSQKVTEGFNSEYEVGEEVMLDIKADDGSRVESITVNGTALEGLDETEEPVTDCYYSYVVTEGQSTIDVVFSEIIEEDHQGETTEDPKEEPTGEPVTEEPVTEEPKEEDTNEESPSELVPTVVDSDGWSISLDNEVRDDEDSDSGIQPFKLDNEHDFYVDGTHLQLLKKNDKNFNLEGAEFTLYAEKDLKTVVDTQTTDSSGVLTMENLIVGKTYYLIETKAPAGYRIPVNPDGSSIVWEIRVNSVPVDNVFEFYVNGTKYVEGGSGDFTVTGTKADRIVNMTVVNPIGLKLPNTGSNLMIPIIILGVVLMGAALVASRKKKEK